MIILHVVFYSYDIIIAMVSNAISDISTKVAQGICINKLAYHYLMVSNIWISMKIRIVFWLQFTGAHILLNKSQSQALRSVERQSEMI